MNLLYIGKYPPLEGGTSVAAYWRIKEYENFGIHTEIITACRKNEFCLPLKKTDNAVTVIESKMDWHIPYTQLFSERLVSAALKISENFNPDLIEGNYFFPYGYAAYIVALILNRPLILRHAGSDFFRLAKNPELKNLFLKMTNSAKRIVTYEDCKKNWHSFISENSNLYFSKRYIPNPQYFYAGKKDENAVMIGKITDKWDKSQLNYWFSKLKEHDFKGKIDIYSNSKRVEEIKKYFERKCIETSINGFISPKSVCGKLSHTAFALISEIPLGISEQSNIAVEANACKCKVIQRDREYDWYDDIEQNYKNYIDNQLKIYDI